MSSDAARPNRTPDDEWDAADMGCGELLMLLNPRVKALPPGGVLLLIARDLGAREDLPAWCRLTGHTLVFAFHPEYWIQRKDKPKCLENSVSA